MTTQTGTNPWNGVINQMQQSPAVQRPDFLLSGIIQQLDECSTTQQYQSVVAQLQQAKAQLIKALTA